MVGSHRTCARFSAAAAAWIRWEATATSMGRTFDSWSAVGRLMGRGLSQGLGAGGGTGTGGAASQIWGGPGGNVGAGAPTPYPVVVAHPPASPPTSTEPIHQTRRAKDMGLPPKPPRERPLI